MRPLYVVVGVTSVGFVVEVEEVEEEAKGGRRNSPELVIQGHNRKLFYLTTVSALEIMDSG